MGFGDLPTNSSLVHLLKSLAGQFPLNDAQAVLHYCELHAVCLKRLPSLQVGAVRQLV